MIMNWLNRISDPLPILLLWTTAAAFVVGGRHCCTADCTP